MIKQIALFLLFTFIFIGCENPIEGVDVSVSPDLFQQTAQVQFFDPSGQDQLEGENVLSVEILGDDAAKLLNDGGEPNHLITDGILSLAVRPGLSQEEPISVVIKVTGENYLTTTLPLTIYAEDTTVLITANLVNLNNAPEGVNVEKITAPLTGNTLTSNLEVITNPSSEGGVSSKVIIPAGTTFMDADGNPITGTNLSATLVNFDASSQSALSSFPGGFSPVGVLNENGEMEGDISFITAGFASIDMYIDGTEIKEFSQPIQITTQINQDVLNPDTEENIKVGDEVPIWSYSRDDGTWEYHSTETVSSSNGSLEVNYTTDHLSWYNLDYYGRRCSKYIRVYTPQRGRWWWPYTWTQNPSYQPTTISFSANNITQSNSRRVLMSFVWAGTNQPISYSATKQHNIYDGKNLNLLNAPLGRPLELVIYSGLSRYRPGEIIYRSPSFTSCSNAFVNVDVNSIISKFPEKVNVTVNYKGFCGEREVRRSQYLYMYDDDYGYYRYVGYVYRGRITIRNIELNKSYTFRMYYKGRRYEYPMSFTSTSVSGEVQVPQEICERFF
ncbi:hypothetical protein [Flammeovirga pacifica]|uniref:Uncharacterized protein n=1 Tax=Flammeovirga pacifica TaxID=915059 RepID=A0A1S1YW72_FLAPC|nr:hypothetical protein [Flammeovirga pacifica]OHX65271.1 hypothetical protein NH26_02375 [Flammeovirga pacifica]